MANQVKSAPSERNAWSIRGKSVVVDRGGVVHLDEQLQTGVGEEGSKLERRYLDTPFIHADFCADEFDISARSVQVGPSVRGWERVPVPQERRGDLERWHQQAVMLADLGEEAQFGIGRVVAVRKPIREPAIVPEFDAPDGVAPRPSG